MKRFLSFSAAVLLLASLAATLGGCGLFGAEDAGASTTEVTEEYSELTTEETTEGLLTETVTEEPAATTTTAPPATTTTKPSTTASESTETTTSAQTSTTKKPDATEPTTKFTPSASSNLSNRVIAPLNSGNYTMSVVITEDEDDQIIKYVSGGNKAYVFKIPSAGYNVRLISLDGKYYMIAKTNTKTIYCEMSGDNYNGLVSLMNKCFGYNFGNLSFQSSSFEFFNAQLYTREVYLRPDGQYTYLWFKNDNLRYVEEYAGTSSASKVGVSVSSGADSSMFSIPEGYTLSTYEEMASMQMSIEMFLQ